MISTLGIDEVVQVVRKEYSTYVTDFHVDDTSRYQVAIENGMFQSVQVNDLFKVENLIHKIKKNYSQLQAKYNRKQKAEQEYMLSLNDKDSSCH